MIQTQNCDMKRTFNYKVNMRLKNIQPIRTLIAF